MMEAYIWRRQSKVDQFIATQSLLNLCEETETKTGARVRGAVLVSGRNRLGRGQGDSGGNYKSGQEWEGKVTREKEEDYWTCTTANIRTFQQN